MVSQGCPVGVNGVTILGGREHVAESGWGQVVRGTPSFNGVTILGGRVNIIKGWADHL